MTGRRSCRENNCRSARRQRDRAIARVDEITALRQPLAYVAAVNGNDKCRAELATMNRQLAELATAIETCRQSFPRSSTAARRCQGGRPAHRMRKNGVCESTNYLRSFKLALRNLMPALTQMIRRQHFGAVLPRAIWPSRRCTPKLPR